jgi:hypothetical protein
LFLKLNCALKELKLQDIEDIQIMWRWHWKLFHNRSSINVSNSYSITGLSV